jgi:hypothetical protein
MVFAAPHERAGTRHSMKQVLPWCLVMKQSIKMSLICWTPHAWKVMHAQLVHRMFQSTIQLSPTLVIWKSYGMHLLRESLPTSDMKVVSEVSHADVPAGATILNSKLDFRIKYNPDGNPSEYKSRLCVRGDQQEEGIDFKEVHAPTAAANTTRLLFAEAAYRDMHVHLHSSTRPLKKNCTCARRMALHR